jgi:hypothetical protein
LNSRKKSDLFSNLELMKSFRERFSVTKLVLLLIILTLIFIEIWNVINGWEISQLFSNVVIAIVSYYFAQKGIQYDEPDSLVERDKWEDMVG